MQNFLAAVAVYLIVLAVLTATWFLSESVWFWVVFFIVTLCVGIGATSFGTLHDLMVAERPDMEGLRIRIPTAAPASPKPRTATTPAGEIGVTTMQTGIQKFYGTLVALMAIMTTAVVVAFFYSTFWVGKEMDLNFTVGGAKIPPESYPILIIAVWTQLQRAKAHWQPKGGKYGNYWWWEDVIEAIAVSIFLGVTFVWAIATGTNLTFVAVMVAFFFLSLGDAFFNARHRFEEDRPASTGLAPAREAAAGETTEILVPHRLVSEQAPTVFRRVGE